MVSFLVKINAISFGIKEKKLWKSLAQDLRCFINKLSKPLRLKEKNKVLSFKK